jgi:hypothetical protein
MKTVKPISTPKDYLKAIERMEFLISLKPKKGSKEYGELDLLTKLILEYQKKKY